MARNHIPRPPGPPDMDCDGARRAFLERINAAFTPSARHDFCREAKMLGLDGVEKALAEFHNQLGDLDAELATGES